MFKIKVLVFSLFMKFYQYHHLTSKWGKAYISNCNCSKRNCVTPVVRQLQWVTRNQINIRSYIIYHIGKCECEKKSKNKVDFDEEDPAWKIFSH